MLTPTIKNKLLDAILRAVPYSGPATVFVSLHSSDPGSTGAGEIAGGGYARQVVAFSAAAGGATANTETLEFTGMPAVTVGWVGLWSASSGGEFLWAGKLTPPAGAPPEWPGKAFYAGDVAQIRTTSLGASVA